jgi:hypothetical protein
MESVGTGTVSDGMGTPSQVAVVEKNFGTAKGNGHSKGHGNDHGKS